MPGRPTREPVGLGKLIDSALQRKGLTRQQLAQSLPGMHINHLHLVMQGVRPLPQKHFPRVMEILDLTQEEMEAAQKETADFRQQTLSPSTIQSILVEARVAQGDITTDQLKLASDLAEKFGGRLSFRLFLDLLREEKK